MPDIIGRKFRVVPAFTYGHERAGAQSMGVPMTGTCIYDHPEGRYAVLEFPIRHGKTITAHLREAFHLKELGL